MKCLQLRNTFSICLALSSALRRVFYARNGNCGSAKWYLVEHAVGLQKEEKEEAREGEEEREGKEEEERESEEEEEVETEGEEEEEEILIAELRALFRGGQMGRWHGGALFQSTAFNEMIAVKGNDGPIRRCPLR
ncbi:hypothetical protein CAPTEDRAFT_214619 [Capitella teleta]|uniref:Uncharacterized protein n=1 Tax=Capitella teleta TaxID=283909 RepID=R7UGB5_CAPTE|nr:hypothetical protein CAPTEDRAFT_214619 [Capitella teleta]|eukprot:ELU05118.1 hypothetical protein CAPTEDRAFT_214619 [Capitella teleta]